ncbi:MAG: choice-of-anchor I family protein, partial [Clostridiales Family XIII bacterium]|nr:choice-of-anchor I family protein [Clostridiales Family XIII bacterium]
MYVRFFRKLKKSLSLIMCIAVIAGMATMPAPPAQAAEEPAAPRTLEIIAGDEEWKYLDTNADPFESTTLYTVGLLLQYTPAQLAPYRIAWTLPPKPYEDAGLNSLAGQRVDIGVDDSAWKSGSNPFGYPNEAAPEAWGTLGTVLNGNIGDTGERVKTYFFRHNFNLGGGETSWAHSAVYKLKYDDAAIVYLNGTEIGRHNAKTGGYSENLQYGCAEAPDDGLEAEVAVAVPPNLLREGSNTIAVELHQDSASSPDIYLNFMRFTLSEDYVLSNDAPTITGLTFQPGANESELNFTWLSNVTGAGILTLKEEGGTPVTFAAEAAALSAREGYLTNKATATGLLPGKTYTSRVSNGDPEDGGIASDSYTFTTDARTDSFSFLLAGDPQIGSSRNVPADTAGWQGTVLKSLEKWQDVSFIISAGDQVEDRDNETHYNGYLSPPELRTIPVAQTVGNHDNSANYLGHFNPPNLDKTRGVTAAGGDYWYTYGDVLFMHLNSNNLSTAEHKAFLEAAIGTYESENGKEPAWKIVVFHHAIYSGASHTDDGDIRQRRIEWSPIFSELDIDAVLAGHDHVYTRSYMMGGTLVTGVTVGGGTVPITEGYTASGDNATAGYTKQNKGETIYITANSASGSKFYAIRNTDYPFVAEQDQANRPTITKVDVRDDALTFSTYYTNDNIADEPIDSFTLNRGAAEARSETPAAGYENGRAALNISQLARYSSGHHEADGGVCEIVAYSPYNRRAYAVNGQDGVLTSISLEGIDGDEVYVSRLDGSNIDVAALVSANGFAYGDLTGVAVSPDGTKLAAAIQSEDYAAGGCVAIFALNADGSMDYEASYATGVQPDMVTFSDGNTVLTADEGEPRAGYGAGTTDPKGSVTVIDLTEPASQIIDFDDFDARRAALAESGVVLKKETAPSVDLEPEYIAVSGGKAYVTLQEANAVAVLELSSKSFTGIYPLGFRDYSKVTVDFDNSIDEDGGAYSPATYANAFGVRMPDGLAAYQAGGKTYIVTANEGDAREWEVYSNEAEYKIKTTDGVEMSKKGRFLTSDYDGLPGISGNKDGVSYAFGSRSFSVFEATAEGLALVYDSGNDFERLTAEYLPDFFNCSNDDVEKDSRSNKKGPEPESVVLGSVNGKVCAFVTLERIGGVMVYDITDPQSVSYVNYINSRDFVNVDEDGIGHDDSAEGLRFVPASESPTGEALLIAAFEVSGDVSVYALTSGTVSPASFTVVFDANDGTVSPATAQTDKSGRLSFLPTPTRSGSYTFEGWYTSMSGGERITVDYVFAADTTVYARWRYNGASGGGSPSGNSGGAPGNAGGDSKKSTDVGGAETIDGSAARVEAKSDDIKTAIGHAKEEKSEVVSVTVTGNEDTKTADVVLPKLSVKEIADNGLKLEVKSPAGDVRLGTDALRTIAAQPGDTLEVVLTEQTKGEFSFAVKVGGAELREFGGTVEVSLPYAKSADEDADLLTAYDESGKEIKGAKFENGRITFETERTGAFTVREWSSPFGDIGKGEWYYKSVRFAYSNELIKGISAETFAPQATLTRAMLVTILAREAGADTAAGSGEKWYDKALNWGIERGMTDGSNPDGEITREQFAVMLWRHTGSPKAAVALEAYADAGSVSDWAAEAMAWAVGNGLITGRTPATLAPDGTATRAEAATLLQRWAETAE